MKKKYLFRLVLLCWWLVLVQISLHYKIQNQEKQALIIMRMKMMR